MNNDLIAYIREQVRKHPQMRAHALENKIAAWEVRRQLQDEAQQGREAIALMKPDRRNLLQRLVARFVEPGAY